MHTYTYLPLTNSMAWSILSTVIMGSIGPNISSCITLSVPDTPLNIVKDMNREDSSVYNVHLQERNSYKTLKFSLNGEGCGNGSAKIREARTLYMQQDRRWWHTTLTPMCNFILMKDVGRCYAWYYMIILGFTSLKRGENFILSNLDMLKGTKYCPTCTY